MRVKAHAPGKLVIIGEYAVLKGAPAIAVAMPARARAQVIDIAGHTSLLRSDASSRAAFTWNSAGNPCWTHPAPAERVAVLEAVVSALRAHGLWWSSPPTLDVTLDSQEFQVAGGPWAGVKLGLGSSAAVTVALTGALLKMRGVDVADSATLLPICMDAHRRLQGGVGSGIDVAAALLGGVVSVNFTAPMLSWPAGLFMLAVWTGRSASTPALVARFDHYLTAGPGPSFRLEELARLARQAVPAWQRGAVDEFLDTFGLYGQALARLDAAADIGIWTAEHWSLSLAAEAGGARFKPSGAGGGDFGIALTDSETRLARLQAQAEAAGLLTLRPGASPGLNVQCD